MVLANCLDELRRIAMAPGVAMTTAAPPAMSGQKNSHTDTSKLNGVFCSTASFGVSR